MGNGLSTALETGVNQRQFCPREIPQVHTHVLLELPFALHDMTGTYTIDTRSVVTIQVAERPKDIAGHNIGLQMSEDVTHLKLDPDNWGHVNFTKATVEFSGYRPIHPPPQADPSDHYLQILKACTRTLQPFLDWYSLATDNYSVIRVSPKDFVHFEAWHTLPPSNLRWNHTFVHFPSSNFSFEAPKEEGDMVLMEGAIPYGKLGDEYTLAYRLYAEARRTLAADDARLAAIQAISSLEVALSHYIDQQISKPAVTVSKKPGTVFGLLELFRQILPKGVCLPEYEVAACNRLRKNRNNAIHDPDKFDPLPVEKDLGAVGSLLSFLVAQEGLPIFQEYGPPGDDAHST